MKREKLLFPRFSQVMGMNKRVARAASHTSGWNSSRSFMGFGWGLGGLFFMEAEWVAGFYLQRSNSFWSSFLSTLA